MKCKMMLVLLALLLPAFVNALGLGKLELQSALNQPFKARVELLSATADELDSLKVSLADQKAFDRAGIQRTFLLTKLRFTVQESEAGSDHIQIRSNDSIREPFLNFLLEINWAKGRLFREYTVLLDPPIYTVPSSKTSSKRGVIHPQSPVVETESGDNQVVYELDESSASEPIRVISDTDETSSYEAAPTINYSGSGDYGPAVTGDTLWSIAKAARPDSSVSIQQMMLAILQSNPEAFIEGNINGLKRGVILEIPDAAEASSLNQSEALAQVMSQHALWDEYSGRVATQVTQRPDGAGATDANQMIDKLLTESVDVESTVEEPVVEGNAELRLISEAEQGSGSDQSLAESSGTDVEALSNELVLANESIEALTMENAELRDKLTETEGIIDDLQRLIVLKEDELAAMQEQIMVAAAEQESAEETEAGTVTEEGNKEKIAKETEEIIEEDKDLEVEVFEEEVLVDVASVDDGLTVVVELAEKLKPYLLIIFGVIIGLLLLIFLMKFVSKRRGKKEANVTLSAEGFTDFGDDESDKTALMSGDIVEDDSESVTVVPGSEDETILPGDSSNEAEIDSDAFEIPEIPEDSSAIEEPEEDPMEEVNVFLAYEHFDEAESFVRKALEVEPDNLAFHSKLLEVFYAAGNKGSYEEAAMVIHEKTGGQGEYWEVAMLMWQEISPNRALFETPVGGEDEEVPAGTTGGGILNIADETDGSGTGDTAFNVTGDDESEGMLDVTAAANMDAISDFDGGAESSGDLDFTLDAGSELEPSTSENKELLDATAVIDPEEATVGVADEEILDISGAEESIDSSELDLSLDEVSLELNTDSPTEDVQISDSQIDDLDISFDEPLGDDEGELDISLDTSSSKSEASEEEMLDMSLSEDGDAANELDISFEGNLAVDTPLLDDSVDNEATGDIDGPDMSFVDSSSESEASEEGMLDMSLSEDGDAASGLDISFEDNLAVDTSSLDDSVDNEATEIINGLDMSFADSSGDGEEEVLDMSLSEDGDTANELDISFEDSASDDVSLLDDSVDSEATESIDGLDLSLSDDRDSDAAQGKNDDLLDVTSAINFESEGGEDLLDVTSAMNSADADDLLESDTADAMEDSSDSVDLDLSLSMGDDSLGNVNNDELIDTGDSTGEDVATGLDFDLDIGESDAESLELDVPELDISDDEAGLANDSIDMDSTVQMPPVDVDRLSLEGSSDDDDKTFLIPKSSNVEEQTEDDEMASQLDLAKAYIELGDNENAKTILDEIIAQGSDNYRKQAEELISQIS